MSKFRPGQSVKINPYVYDDKWEGHKELYRKFNHHNLVVDRVIDMTEVGKGELVIVDYLGKKDAVKPSYLWDTTFGDKKEIDDNKTFKMKKTVTVIMEVDTDESDEFIKNDLEQEINCASCFYEIKEIKVESN